jgi:chromosome segregation ATPase
MTTRDDIERIRAAIAQWDSNLAEPYHAVRTLLSEYDSARATIIANQVVREQLEARIARAESRVRELEAELPKLRANIGTTRAQLLKELEQANRTIACYLVTNDEGKSWQERAEAAEARVRELEADVRELEADVRAGHQVAHGQAEIIDALEQRLARIRERLDRNHVHTSAQLRELLGEKGGRDGA